MLCSGNANLCLCALFFFYYLLALTFFPLLLECSKILKVVACTKYIDLKVVVSSTIKSYLVWALSHTSFLTCSLMGLWIQLYSLQIVLCLSLKQVFFSGYKHKIFRKLFGDMSFLLNSSYSFSLWPQDRLCHGFWLGEQY